MEKTVQVPELKEEFHAVMEDIKPKDIMELEEMYDSIEPPLLRPEHCIKVEEEIITIMEDDDPDEVEILEVIDNSDVDPPVLSPNYEDSRDRRSSEVLEKRLPLLCRLCATRSDGMINMFDPSEQHRNIVQKIEYCCLPIEVKKNDNLSTAACQLCLAKLELSYQFYKTVTEAKKFLTLRDQTFRTPKIELIPDESIKNDIISDDSNDLDKCRTNSLSHEHQDADSSSNALELSTNQVPITNVTMVNNVISSDVNHVDENRTRSSNDKRRRTDLTCNVLISSTKKASITDATVENNIISSDGTNRDKEGTESSNNKRRKTDLSSNALSSSTDKTPITNPPVKKNIISPNVDNIRRDRTKSSSDTDRETDLSPNALTSATKELSITDPTAKKMNISSIVKDVDEDRTQNSNDKCRKTDPSSNTSSLRKATLQLKQATPHSVPNDPMCPNNADEEFTLDVQRSDSPLPPVSRSRKASNDSRKNGMSGHPEQPSCNLSGKQLSTHTEINTHETNTHQGSNDTSQLLPYEHISIKMEPIVGMYYCKYCDEQCEGEINLLDHMRVHIYEYPFNCSICDKAFKTRERRNYHIVTHTKEEEFPCNTCNASFASKYALRTHERSIHRDIKREGRGYRSRNRHRTSYSSSNTSNASKGRYIADATVQNNVISSNLNNFEENNPNDEREKTNSPSNASNCSVTGAHRTDATIQNNVISSNLNTLGKHSLNDERRKINSPSNALNLNTASFERTQDILNSVLDRPTLSIYSDKILRSNRKSGFKKESGSNEELGCKDFAPIKTSHETSGNPRKEEEVSKQNEKPSCDVSEEQIRTQGQVNTRERKCKRPTSIQLKPEKQLISLTTTLKYDCADCGRRTRTKRLMRDHILLYHLTEPGLDRKCEICDKSFRSRNTKADHMRVRHSKHISFECDMCGARFRRRCNMSKHRILHTKWDLKK